MDQREGIPVVQPGQEERAARAETALRGFLREIDAEERERVEYAARTALIRSGVLGKQGQP